MTAETGRTLSDEHYSNLNVRFDDFVRLAFGFVVKSLLRNRCVVRMALSVLHSCALSVLHMTACEWRTERRNSAIVTCGINDPSHMFLGRVLRVLVHAEFSFRWI